MKKAYYVPLLMIALMAIILTLSFKLGSYILFFIGLIGTVVNIGLYVILLVFSIKQQESDLDYDSLKQQGLHIVECPNCHKKNVLEDVWCIRCGEKLDEQ
jgi:Ca2+/H+ antiporter